MMKKKKKSFSLKPVVLLSAAALLLAGSTVGSTRAALTYYSENYAAEVTVSSIGVSLVENGNVVSNRDYNHKNDEWSTTSGTLLKGMLAEGEKFVPGKTYNEALSVKNSGSIDTYVRVLVYKNWTKDGEKAATLSPDLIDLNITPGNGWVEDKSASTAERTVLYYTGILAPGAATPAFTDTLKVDSSITKKVTEEVSTDGNGNKTITTVYDYDGYQFSIEAEVDAVQTHNAEDAIKSAWGVDVSVSGDGSLSLR